MTATTPAEDSSVTTPSPLVMVLPTWTDPMPPVALPAGWSLRSAGSDDAAALAGLLTEAFRDHWDPARVERELLDNPEVLVTWVLTDPRDAVVATASERSLPQTFPDQGYVHFVAVSEAARGRRLGAALTAQCLNGFRDRGMAGAVLETHPHRLAAIATYLRLGFTPHYSTIDDRALWSAVFRQIMTTRTHQTAKGEA